MPFQQLGLPAALLHNARRLGFETPTPIQARAIPAALEGRDLVATAQTGTGKTAAFLFPVLSGLLGRQRGSTGALVLSPTRELAGQIEAVARSLVAGTPLKTALVVGGAGPVPQARALRAGVDLVVATPGRLIDHLGAGSADFRRLAFLVLDEADQMFDMGFLPAIKRIVARLPVERQTLLFSATMPPEVAALTRSVMRNPQTVSVGPAGKAAATVNQTVLPVPAGRKAALLGHLLDAWDSPSVLVFTRTKHGAKRLTRVLAESGRDVAELHGNRSPAQRERALAGFRSGAVPVLVATNVAARGLDVRHVTHVVNFDVPDAPEDYVHRVGRTGRAGDTGDAVVFVSPEEGERLARIERQLGKKLPRRQLPDFDYAAPSPRPAQKVRPGAAPKPPAHPRPATAGRPAGGPGGRRPGKRPARPTGRA